MGNFTTIVLSDEPEDPRLVFPIVEGEPAGTHPILLQMKYSKFPPGDVYYLSTWGKPNVEASNILTGTENFWRLVKEAGEEGRHLYITHTMFQTTAQHAETITRLLDSGNADIVSFIYNAIPFIKMYSGNKVSLGGFAIRNELLNYVVPDYDYRVSTFYIDLVFQVLQHTNPDRVMSIMNMPLPYIVLIKSPYSMDYALYRIADALHFNDKWGWWDKHTSESPVLPPVVSLYDLVVAYSVRKTGTSRGETLLFGLLKLFGARDVYVKDSWEHLIPTALYLLGVKGTLRTTEIPPVYLDEMRKAGILNYVGTRLILKKDLGNPDVAVLRAETSTFDELEELFDVAKKAVILSYDYSTSFMLGKYMQQTSAAMAYEFWASATRRWSYFVTRHSPGLEPLWHSFVVFVREGGQ